MAATIQTDQGKVPATAEIGRSGLNRTGGTIREEFNPDLQGRQAVKVYDEMRRNEPTVAIGLNAIKWVLGQVNWEVQAGGDTPADLEAAAFLESCMTDMSQTWSKLVRDALACLDFGWSYCEIVYKQRAGQEADPPSRYDDGRLGWRKFTMVGHSTLSRWDLDDKGGISGLYQTDWSAPTNGRTSAWGEIYVPIQKSVLFRLDDEKNNPEGVSLLRAAYAPWYKKKNIEEIEAIGIERDLTGILIIQPPEGATSQDQSKALDLLEQFKADDMTGFYAPRTGAGPSECWTFSIIGSPGNKSIDTNQVIGRYAYEIARAFLVQFLLLGQGQTGSWALARDQHDLFTVALGAILQNLTETLNRFAVVPLFRLNDFGTLTKLPELRPGRIAKADMDRFSKSLSALVTAGLVTPGRDIEGFVRSELDLPELPKATDESAPPEETGKGEGQPERKPPAAPSPPEPPAAPSRQESEPEQDAEPAEMPPPYDDDAEAEVDEILRGLRHRATEAALRSFATPPKRIDYTPELDALRERYAGLLGGLARDFREGKLTYEQWVQGSKDRIAEGTRAAHKLGLAEAKGIYPPWRITLSPADKNAADRLVGKQYDWLLGFRDDVQKQRKAGEPLTTALDARARMYGEAALDAFQAAKIGVEDARPMRWIRHPGDSCETCLEMGDKVKTSKDWRRGGVWPGHGVKCHSNCRCDLAAEVAEG